MQITRWDPFTALSRLDRDFDDLIRRTWSDTRPLHRGVTGFIPAVEVVRDGSDMIARFELPGIDADRDVEITLANGRLTVAGERRVDAGKDVGGVLVRELRYGSFRREFTVPEHVTAAQVEARYDAGMLTIRVRDVAPATPEPVRVPVQSPTGSAATKAATEDEPQS